METRFCYNNRLGHALPITISDDELTIIIDGRIITEFTDKSDNCRKCAFNEYDCDCIPCTCSTREDGNTGIYIEIITD